MATFQRRKNRWRWEINLTGLPRTSGTCPTKACAVSCAREAEVELKAGRAIRGRVTLAEAINRFTALYLPRIPDSAPLYRRHLVFWRAELGRRALAAITPPMISACKLKLAAMTSRYGRPLAPATVNRYLITLSSLFSWAASAEVGLVERNPVMNVEKLREPPERVRFLSRPVDETGSEFERLIAACRASRSRCLLDVVILLLTTGCRENEIMSLRRQDIRLNEGGFLVRTEIAKTEEPRWVPLSGMGLEVVKRRLSVPRIDSPYLFPGHNGRAATFPRSAWLKALTTAAIEDLRPHDLRHTYASYLAMEGHSLPEIMAALGHKSMDATMRYAHLAQGHKNRVSEGVNRTMAAWAGNG
jgi:integrase